MAGDANLSRYVGNGAPNSIDPTGMQPPDASDPDALRRHLETLQDELMNAHKNHDAAYLKEVEGEIKNEIKTTQRRIRELTSTKDLNDAHKKMRNAAHADPLNQAKDMDIARTKGALPDDVSIQRSVQAADNHLNDLAKPTTKGNMPPMVDIILIMIYVWLEGPEDADGFVLDSLIEPTVMGDAGIPPDSYYHFDMRPADLRSLEDLADEMFRIIPPTPSPHGHPGRGG